MLEAENTENEGLLKLNTILSTDETTSYISFSIVDVSQYVHLSLI